MSSNVPDDPLELRLRAALAPRRTTAEFLREVQAEIERAPASRERAPQDGTWLQRAAAGLPPLGATSWPGWKSALFVLGLPLLALLALLAALGWSLTRWRGLVRDCEKRFDVSEAMIDVAMSSLLLRRLCH